MNLETLMLASVSRKSVYRRLAALSEEEKQQVVEKVKQKLKEKYPESGDSQDTEGEAPAEGEETSQGEEAPAAESDDTSKDTGGDDYFPPTESGDGDVPTEDDVDTNTDTEESGESAKPGFSKFPAEPDDTSDKGEEPEEDKTDEAGSTPAETTENKSSESDKDEEEKPEEDEQKEAGGEVVAAPEESAEEDISEDDDFDDDGEDEDDDIPVEEGTPAGEIVDEIEEDVEQIGQDGRLEPGRVIELFETMLKLHALLLQSKLPRGIKARRNRTSSETMVDRLTMDIVAGRVAARGLQLNRKDKDTMTDTGGTSKGITKEPEFKPSRTDVKKPFRSKDKPADQRDPDTDTDPDNRKD
jgi:hypothetical protein